ncbi:MAG: hypothetical protein PVJ60_03980 [Phycisphaerales bacterium]|jgi:hypothetical protein
MGVIEKSIHWKDRKRFGINLQGKSDALYIYLNYCFNAITQGQIICDERGIVYKQEFGKDFVDKIEQLLTECRKDKADD